MDLDMESEPDSNHSSELSHGSSSSSEEYDSCDDTSANSEDEENGGHPLPKFSSKLKQSGNSGLAGDNDTLPAEKLRDLRILFDEETLRRVHAQSCSIDKDLAFSRIQNLKRWLREMADDYMAHHTVTVEQWCEKLAEYDVGEEAAREAFSTYDTEGNGKADIDLLRDAVSNKWDRGSLVYCTKVMQSCVDLPGFVDVFASSDPSTAKKAHNLLTFVKRNRVDSTSFSLPALAVFTDMLEMRQSALTHILQSITVDKRSIAVTDAKDGGIQEVEKAYRHIEVSSSRRDTMKENLEDGNTSTYWQSDGSSSSHWIRLKIKKNVLLKHLSIYISSHDQSYYPIQIAVSVGKRAESLREVRTVRAPTGLTGYLPLLENMTEYLPFVQIRIKRCLNDGCDTRVHLIKAIGLKQIEEPALSVGDAGVKWLLGLITSTALHSINTAPHLKGLFLTQTKEMLRNMAPLSLTAANSRKPKFITDVVLTEVSTFLDQMTRDVDESLSEQSLLCRIRLGLACCQIPPLIDTLITLLEEPSKNFDSEGLVTDLNAVKEKWWSRGARRLTMSYVACDSHDESKEGASPKVLLDYRANSKNEMRPEQTTYKAISGTKQNTILFEFEAPMQVTRVGIRSPRGDSGTKRGAVFILPDLETLAQAVQQPNPKEGVYGWIFEHFSNYDTWKTDDFKGALGSSHCPIGLMNDFTFPSYNEEATVESLTPMVGKYLLIKCMEPKSKAAEYISLAGIEVFGYPKQVADSTLTEDGMAAENKLTHQQLCDVVMSFLVSIIHSCEHKDGKMGGKTKYITVKKLQVSRLIQMLYRAFELEMVNMPAKVLLLVHTVLSQWKKGHEDPAMSQLFDLLCSIIDNHMDYKPEVVLIAKRVVKDGALALFPNDEIRKERLLKLLHEMNSSSDNQSTNLIFESLCLYFSDVDPSALHLLPTEAQEITEGAKDPTALFGIMGSLVAVMLSSAEKLLSNQGQPNSEPAYIMLVRLCSALQTWLFAWIEKCRQVKENQPLNDMSPFLVAYIDILVSGYEKFITFLTSQPSANSTNIAEFITDSSKHPFLLLHELIIYTRCFTDDSHDYPMITLTLKTFSRVSELIQGLEQSFPTLFVRLSEDNLKIASLEPEILHTWVEESKHNYENNTNYSRTFQVPGASSYTVEFDSKCRTERTYDYLEFKVGNQEEKCHGTLNDVHWPGRLEFKGISVDFTFITDGSGNEWGYKFKITAHGSPQLSFSPLFDLHLSMADLIGFTCGQMITETPSQATDKDKQELENEEVMLKSTLWRTLFRAGYDDPSHHLSRSLSGSLALIPEGVVKNFLLELLEGSEDPIHQRFLANLREKCKHHRPIGTEEIGQAVIHAFAALVWHTTELRCSLNDYISSDHDESQLVEGIYQAFGVAEHLRLPLVHLRQKSMGSEEDNTEFTFPQNIMKKADMLFKFAPLTKVSTPVDHFKSRGWSKARKGAVRIRSADSDIYKQIERHIPERYNTFYMVLEFIIEPSWTCELVDQAIKARTIKAKSVCEAYQRISQYLSQASLVNLQNVVMLRSVLASQKGFPRHYNELVDGCGLKLETQLRKAYYQLIRWLVSGLLAESDLKAKSKILDQSYALLQACLLHLIHIEWRENDLKFVQELNLPQIYYDIARDNAATFEPISVETDPKVEMEVYKNSKKWLEQKDSIRQDRTSDLKERQMFIAKHCDILNANIICDGCNAPAPGPRYRCLECKDIDLCVTCFTGGVNPGITEHTPKHSFVYLLYKCDICKAFIASERVHCNVCEDYDLCYGCHEEQSTTTGPHSPSHDVTRIPQTKWTPLSNEPITSYIHHYAWLDFSQLTLTLAQSIFDQSSMAASDSQDYLNTAVQLLTQCLKLLTDCLDKASSLSDGGVQLKEETFVRHSQEKIMGLLGAVFMQHDPVIEANLNPMLTSVSFLKFIFQIASGLGGFQQNAQIMALGLLVRLMQKSTLSQDVATTTDLAVIEILDKHPSAFSVEIDSSTPGETTINFLVKAASGCLEKPQGSQALDWTYSIIRLLQQLAISVVWKPITMNYLINALRAHKESCSIELVVCLYILTGFPTITTPGQLINFRDGGVEEKEGVVFQHFQEKSKHMIVDCSTRKRRLINDNKIMPVNMKLDKLPKDIIEVITQIILETADNLAKGGVVNHLNAEMHWILYLCLKAFNHNLVSLSSYFDLDMVRRLVTLSAMGTRVSKYWLSSDLEVMSLLMYTRMDHTQDISEGCQTAESRLAESSGVMQTPDKDKSLAAAVDNGVALMREALKLRSPRERLQELAEKNAVDPKQVLEMFDLMGGSPSSKESPSKNKNEAISLVDKKVDFGVLPLSKSLPPLISSDKLVAVKEKEDKDSKSPKKKPHTPEPKAETKRREASAKLLKDHLAQINSKSPSTTAIKKVNMALAILHARQALVTILAQWPTEAPAINSELLDCAHGNLALILDVLSRDSDEALFKKVVGKVMHCWQSDTIRPIAEAASYFMEISKLNKVIRTSPRDKNQSQEIANVQLAGASFLIVTFDSCCRLSDSDILIISSTADLQEQRHEFTGCKGNWGEIELTGDILYYHYTPSGVKGSLSQWKFTVMGEKAFSFDTGFIILDHIFKEPSCCRLVDIGVLWAKLAVIACEQTGEKRFKAISLLLRILEAFRPSVSDSGDHQLDLSKLDLSYLRPLWVLYKEKTEDHLPTVTTPHLVRALTELFVVAEEIVEERGRAQELAVLLVDPKMLIGTFKHEVQRVNAVCKIINYNADLLNGSSEK